MCYEELVGLGEDIEQHAQIIIEGTIRFKSTEPSPGQFRADVATHWFWDIETANIVKGPLPKDENPEAFNLEMSYFLRLGFWTDEFAEMGSWSFQEGDEVRACLQISVNEKTVYLTPLADEAALTNLSASTPSSSTSSVSLCTNYGLPRDYAGNGLAIRVGLVSPFYTAYSAEIYSAANQLNRHTDAKISIWPIFFSTATPGHYSLGWGRVSSPSSLGTTLLIRNGKRPGLYSYYPMNININKNWSKPGKPPAGDEYDMVSLLMHEMGHAIGLWHLDSNINNVMHSRQKKGVQYSLQALDIQCMNQLA